MRMNVLQPKKIGIFGKDLSVENGLNFEKESNSDPELHSYPDATGNSYLGAEKCQLNAATSPAVIYHLKPVFAKYGIPKP